MEQLFSKDRNQSATVYPVRMVYILKDRSEGGCPIELLISVSKRHFKRAVKRNRVKRQLREAYRHQRHLLEEQIPEDKTLAAAFIWQADELCDSRRVSYAIGKLMGKVAGRL